MYVVHRRLAIRVEMADVAVGDQTWLAGEDIRYLIEIVVRVLDARPFTVGVARLRRKMDDGDACEMRLQRTRK